MTGWIGWTRHFTLTMLYRRYEGQCEGLLRESYNPAISSPHRFPHVFGVPIGWCEGPTLIYLSLAVLPHVSCHVSWKFRRAGLP